MKESKQKALLRSSDDLIETYDLTDKTIIPFATSGGSGIGKTNERLAPSCKGAKLMDGKVFKDNVGHQELAAWVEGLGL